VKPVRKLRSRSYSEVIEVDIPTRFYWIEKGYDGMEFGPLPKGTTRYQLRLLTKVLRNARRRSS
jgi:hypothetical protein